jgi:uncharacterized cupin superfamily protein
MSADPPILNLDAVDIQRVEGAKAATMPEDYDLRCGEISRRIGARKLGYNLTVVAPGKRACPFHSHRAEEEMFLILEGEGELRYGGDRHPLRTGDVIACPTGGPETAHQIINTGATELRYFAVSTKSEAEVCQYPDSGKIGAFAEGEPERLRHLTRASDARDYWENE